jgi:hypothetical protein
MGPFSHYYLAAKLQPVLQPEEPAQYLWGAVVPDIRYLAQLRREHTHVGRERLAEGYERYPHLKSFLLGYQVHCEIDQIDVAALIRSAFPFNVLRHVLRRDLSAQQLTMLVEMDFLQKPFPALVRLAGTHNDVLRELGIVSEQTQAFYQTMQTYIDSHSIDGAVSAMDQLGMIENARLEKYRIAHQTLKNKKFIQALLLLSVRNAKVDQVVLKVDRLY